MKAFFIKIIKIFLIGIGIAALGWIVLIMLPKPVFGPEEDVELGKQVVMSIEESGEAENTQVWFMSDNGGCAEFLNEDGGAPSSFRYQIPTADGRPIRPSRPFSIRA